MPEENPAIGKSQVDVPRSVRSLSLTHMNGAIGIVFPVEIQYVRDPK
jgi:hypothetical protein